MYKELFRLSHYSFLPFFLFRFRFSQYLLHARPDNDGLAEEVGYALVHQRVGLYEIQSEIRQRPAVVVTLARSGIRYFGTVHRQPVRIDGRLLFEVPLKGVGDVLQREGANGAAGNAIRRRRKCAVDELGRYVAVFSLYQFRGRLWMVENKNS